MTLGERRDFQGIKIIGGYHTQDEKQIAEDDINLFTTGKEM